MDTNVFRNMSYGLYLISTMDNDRPTGCVANSAMQITSAPATIAVSINHDNYTNLCIAKNQLFALNVLQESCDPTLISTFGFQSGKTVDKFKGVQHHLVMGVPVVDDTLGYIILKVTDTMETSTHTVFLAEVIDGKMQHQDVPMTYAYYHQVVRGKAPKNAPTYIAEENNQKEKWVCTLCGHIYEGDIPFEQLPEDWTCPICMQPKNVFEKK